MRAVLFAFLLTACGGSAPATCPPGLGLTDWQVISDSRSTWRWPCPTRLEADLGAYGSVWTAPTVYGHGTGTVRLSASVRSDCPAGWEVRMSVSTTTRRIDSTTDRYALTAQPLDPWLVAVGVLSQGPCTATIDDVQISIGVTP